MALSFPHFFQADKYHLQYAEGLKPNKEKHQSFVDLHPETGTPLAFLKIFQENVIIERDSDVDILRFVIENKSLCQYFVFSDVADKIALPLLWVEDGHGGPSDEMVAAIKGDIKHDDADHNDHDDNKHGKDLKIDYSFLPKVPNMMTHLEEFKVRLLLKEKVEISPGETKLVSTTTIIDGKLEGFGMSILAHENASIQIESGGHIHILPDFRGRIILQVTNLSKHDLSLPASSSIGYLVIYNLALLIESIVVNG